MRIIAGKYKNRNIQTPTGRNTRPILSRVRKSLMDILEPYIEGARVLDLYTGTGILSLESLSRGAAFALCVESDRHACELIKQNRGHVCPRSPMRIVQGDVLKCLPSLRHQEEAFDIIGITPPYGEGLENKTLAVLQDCPSLFHEDTIVFAQRHHKDDMKLDWPLLEHVRTKNYGKTVIEFFLRAAD